MSGWWMASAPILLSQSVKQFQVAPGRTTAARICAASAAGTVMVTGMGVEADAEGTEPIVKKAITHSAIAAEENLLCRIINILC